MQEKSLKQMTKHCVTDYLNALEGDNPSNLHQLFMGEVESALLESVMEHAKQNQTSAALFLGINRGTLRKKLKTHGLID